MFKKAFAKSESFGSDILALIVVSHHSFKEWYLYCFDSEGDKSFLMQLILIFLFPDPSVVLCVLSDLLCPAPSWNLLTNVTKNVYKIVTSVTFVTFTNP
jgi:hypothetical protein